MHHDQPHANYSTASEWRETLAQEVAAAYKSPTDAELPEAVTQRLLTQDPNDIWYTRSSAVPLSVRFARKAADLALLAVYTYSKSAQRRNLPPLSTPTLARLIFLAAEALSDADGQIPQDEALIAAAAVLEGRSNTRADLVEVGLA